MFEGPLGQCTDRQGRHTPDRWTHDYKRQGHNDRSRGPIKRSELVTETIGGTMIPHTELIRRLDHEQNRSRHEGFSEDFRAGYKAGLKFAIAMTRELWQETKTKLAGNLD